MTTPTTSNTRIAKNTLLLYIRMAVAMLVLLYTSRVVLQVLGVDDFGIWSVVGTLVVMISFITAPLSTATQRFINVALGEHDENNARSVFNQSFILYACFAVVLLVILETIGLWFLSTRMDIPNERLSAAIYAYHFVVASFVLSLFRAPFEALLIAHQRFDIFAIIGITDVMLKLLIVFLLPYAPNRESLIFYAFLLFIVAFLIITLYYILCRANFQSYRIRLIWDKNMVKALLSFMGWTTFGSFASISGTQGIAIVINLFCGVAANAAMGLANQVSAAINQFVSNFQMAFQPQIVQSYAANEKNNTLKLICFASKISFLLIYAIGCPLIFNIDYVLELWLDRVPLLTSKFCILIICISILEAISAPLWMVVQATGKIRTYQIIISTLLFSTILIGYILLKHGYQASSVLYGKILVLVVCLIYRIYAVKKLTGYSIKIMIKGFLIPEIVIIILTLPIIGISYTILPENNLIRLFGSTLTFLVFLSVISYWIILTNSQRIQLCNFMRKKLTWRKPM